MGKYERIEENLRKKILGGDLPPGSKLPSQNDLALTFKVNKHTAGHALEALVREGLITRKRGSGTFVSDLENPPVIPGRNLRLGMLSMHSVVSSRMEMGFHGQTGLGVLKGLGLQGLGSQFTIQNEQNLTRAVWDQPERGITVEMLGEAWRAKTRHPPLSAVKAGRFDGLITLSIYTDDWIEKLLKLGLPTVLVDYPNSRFSDRADEIFVDPMLAYDRAVQELVQRGCERIHYFGLMKWQAAKSQEHDRRVWRQAKKVPFKDPDSFLRYTAYLRALDRIGIEPRPEWIHFEHIDKSSMGKLAERWMALPEQQRPQALVCHEVSMADHLARAFAERGLHLEGAGATFNKSYSGPALPIFVDAEETGALAAELLLQRIQRPHRPFLRVGTQMTLGISGVPQDAAAAAPAARA